jgi:hypothetical protein
MKGICMSNMREQEIIVLLRDYMNILPSGPQEAFVPLGSGGGLEDSWPLTAESIIRMDSTNYIGETYVKLDAALARLEREYPMQYEALLKTYLHEGAGHRDVDFLRQRALVNGNPKIIQLLELHDDAITTLADYLSEDDLWVRWPQKAPGPRPAQNMDERHDQLYAIFLRYIEEGIPYRQSIKNAAFKMTDLDGEPYYSQRHAERIIKPRWVEQNEQPTA